MAGTSEGERVAREQIAWEADERRGFLDLGRLGLTELPAELFGLKHLRSLNLGSGWRDGSGGWSGSRRRIGENRVAVVIGHLLACRTEGNCGFRGRPRHAFHSGKLDNLQSIDCSGTQVSDLAPLADLQALQSINCSETQVSDLAPLAGLQALQSIDCSANAGQRPGAARRPAGAPVDRLLCDAGRDLAPLAAPQGAPIDRLLRNSFSDLAPLAGLKALQSIDRSNTQVSDLAPLAGLQALQSIDCFETQVSDLAPLASLQALQSIDCSDTQVTDLAPLAGLQALQSIDARVRRSAT